MSAEARGYLEHAVSLMQAHSYKRLAIDWDAFRSAVFARVSAAQSTSDTYPGIALGTSLLADNHSTFATPSGYVLTPRTRSCSAPDAVRSAVPANISYVKVGTFGGIGDTALAYADELQRAIAAADAAGVTAWIVDVRGNGGGNMWPMVAGVGPLLGEGVIGYFVDPVGQEVAWHYRDGASWEGSNLAQRVSAPHTLRHPRPRVAVLIDAGVASSGEATVIAFRGRSDTRSFGTATCGLSTAIENYALSDGARLNLAISVMADRTRATYGYAVSADEFILDPAEVVPRAIEWLQEGR